MNACETAIIQNSAKSCIQTFLKQTEHFSRQHHFSGGFAIESALLPDDNNFKDSAVFEDVDNQNNFNYSQKLFHIADGNLYSIFSPIQGRSYGMKPSFLRKQKYTVQECHSRGRKNLRKGLKFHNFLPSESITSEKGILQTKWKVHSECRLKEEHGTKQITISNWSQNIQATDEEPAGESHFRPQTQNISSNDNLSYNQSIQSDQNAYENESHRFKLSPDNEFQHPSEKLTGEKRQTSKKGSLKNVLTTLLDKPVVAGNPICDLPLAHTKSSLSFKHRRKPVQTRRVVPYTKYLSIIEEDDTSSPLDLSSNNSEVKGSTPLEVQINLKKETSDCDNIYSFTNAIKSDNASSTNLNSLSTNGDSFKNSSLAHLLQTQIPSPLVLLTSPILNVKPTYPGTNSKIHDASQMQNGTHVSNPFAHPQSHSNPGPSRPESMQYAFHKSFIKNSQPKSRRRSQRSVIKKNLEDTFKQNGFLVKTKQVSDGEATFCKFRQLRKYTRYYLKSWQQHLPDEVNKMWKGFLPPKTVLPAILGNSESTQ